MTKQPPQSWRLIMLELNSDIFDSNQKLVIGSFNIFSMVTTTSHLVMFRLMKVWHGWRDHAVHAHNKHWIPHGMVQVALGAHCYLDTNLSPRLSTRINSDGETERWHHQAGVR